MDAKALARHLIVDSLAAMGSVLPFVVFSATSWLSGPFALNVGGLAALLGVFATVLGLSMRRRIPNATEVHVLERWLALQTDAGRDFSVALAAGGVACLGVHLLGGTAFDEGAWAFLFSTSFIALVGGGVLQGQLEGTLKPFIADAFRATLAPTGVLRRSWQTTTVGRRLGILTAGAFGSAFFIARASGESVNIAIGFCAAALPVAWAAQLFSRGISHAARSARLSLESLTGGLREPPDWMGPDELGVLALRVAQVVEDQGSLTGNLVGSAEQLSSASRRLGHATMQQNENLARQAAAIQQTEVTAHEIQQTSSLALQKTALVLQEAERAESITEAGELAIEESLSGLTNISAEVDEMARSIRALGERTRAIVSITTTVKELADQSNMLALNAAIEAVRSGEHGRGFAVVAREIRALADQSLQATRQVRALLDSIASAIQATVAISDRGNARVRESVVQVQSSGESLRELSSIVRDNAQAMRQISAAVGQQNTGISQVFDAIRELSGMMDVTLGALESSESAAFVIDEVAAKISSSVSGLGQTETSHQSVDGGRTARAAA